MARPPSNQPASQKGPRVNNQISTTPVRVVGADGEMLGVLPILEALKAAEAAGLDLVEISPNTDPPVCKILDYGKYKYEAQKKKAEAKKKQKVVEIKEIKMRPSIDTHDYEVKMKAVRKFLEHGDKVKVTLRFRGREVAHQELGMKLLDRVQAEIDALAKVEQTPKMEGRMMTMVIAPK